MKNISTRTGMALASTLTACAVLSARMANAQDVIGWGDIGFSNLRGISNNVASVSAGSDFTAALKNDGSVAVWGLNGSGNVCVIPKFDNAFRVACGARHLLVLSSDGTLRAFGDSTSIPTDLPLITAIAAGSYHSIALGSDGVVRCWGSNSDGQCNAPAGSRSVSKIAAGNAHSLSINSAGNVLAWGSNSHGQASVPADLGSSIAIAGGGEHSVAVRADGTVRCWGRNENLQCIAPDLLSHVIAVTAGDAFSVALQDSGTVVAWGSQPVATLPPGLSDVVEIDAGRNHCIARMANGQIVCWGDNERGQCRFPQGLGDVIDIGTGGYDYTYAGISWTAALTSDGRVSTWGYSRWGIGDVPDVAMGCTAISAGGYGGAALRQDGSAFIWGAFWCWGAGNLNVGNLAQVATNSNPWYGNGLGRKRDGSVVYWGRGDYGEGALPQDLGLVRMVACGPYHVGAIRTDGKVRCWGNNGSNQCIVPSSLASVVDLALGGNHSLALRADGTVRCWGNNGSGQSVTPPNLNDVVQVAAGTSHSVALKADGVVVGWGDNGAGQCTQPPGLGRISRISAGGYATAAIVAKCDQSINDFDGDGVSDCEDNCPTLRNVDQLDCNHNGVGDACEIFTDCNLNGVPDSCDIAAGAPDFNSDTILDTCQCIADLVLADHQVNGADLGALLSQWGPANAGIVSDINRDGVVNGADLGLLLNAWGPCPN